MKVTIIIDDKTVYVDGVSFSPLDLSFLDSNIHAIQWKDNSGWIEFKEDEEGNKPANIKITDFTPFSLSLDKWNEAKLAYEIELLEAAKKKELANNTTQL